MQTRSLIKMLGVGSIMIIGGPALVSYLRPTEEELFKKFNPELQRRNLDLRYQRQKDFDDFVTQLKGLSKSDKSIWDAYKDTEGARVREYNERRKRELAEEQAQKAELQKELSGS